MSAARLVPTILVSLFVLTLALTGRGAEPGNGLVNGGFETGLSGWTIQGEARLHQTVAPLDGHGIASPRPGEGGGAAAVRDPRAENRLRWRNAASRLARGHGACARCYDSMGRLVMDLTQGLDPKKA